LLGYDIYNNRISNLKARITFLIKECPKTIWIRFARFGVSYGLGGISNRKIKHILL